MDKDVKYHRQKIFQEMKKKGVRDEYIRAEYNIGISVEDISNTHNIAKETVEDILTLSSDEEISKDPTKTDLIPHLEGDDKRLDL